MDRPSSTEKDPLLPAAMPKSIGARPDSSSPTRAAGRHLPSLLLGTLSFGESGGVMCARKCKGKGRQESGERTPSAGRSV